jgi:hypothetical protein
LLNQLAECVRESGVVVVVVVVVGRTSIGLAGDNNSRTHWSGLAGEIMDGEIRVGTKKVAGWQADRGPTMLARYHTAFHDLGYQLDKKEKRAKK